MPHLQSIVHTRLLEGATYIDRMVDLYALAQRLGMEVIECDTTSALTGSEEMPYVVLDARLSEPEKRVALAHEIVHYAAHCGNQLLMGDDFRLFQEKEADLMVFHLLCPTRDLSEELEGRSFRDPEEAATFIAERFGVPIPFAHERLRRFRRETYDANMMFGRDFDTVWEHPATGHKVYFKNGHLAGGMILD